jgi:hypothetical protein
MRLRLLIRGPDELEAPVPALGGAVGGEGEAWFWPGEASEDGDEICLSSGDFPWLGALFK